MKRLFQCLVGLIGFSLGLFLGDYLFSKNFGGGFPQFSRTTVAAPTGPSALSSTANGFTQIDLSWTDNSADELGFNIYRSPSGTDSWQQIHTTPANITTYSDPELNSGTTYYYRVEAFNIGGRSSSQSGNASTAQDLWGLVTDQTGGLLASLRRANANYTGNIIRIRRDTDQAEIDIGYIGEDLDTAAIVSHTTGLSHNFYTSDFSIDNDGWTIWVLRGTVDGNIDGIGGQDDNLRVNFGSANPDLHSAIGRTELILANHDYTFSFDVYIPSSNTSINDVDYFELGTGAQLEYDLSGSITLDTWTSYSVEIDNADGTDPRIVFAGSGNHNGDVAYVRNIQIVQKTADALVVRIYDQSGISSNGDRDFQSPIATQQMRIAHAGVVNTLHGKPYLDATWAGGGRYYATIGSFNYTEVGLSKDHPNYPDYQNTFLHVIQTRSDGATGTFIGQNFWYLQSTQNDVNYRVRNSGIGQIDIPHTTQLDGTHVLLSAHTDGTTAWVRVDSTPLGLGSPTGDVGLGGTGAVGFSTTAGLGFSDYWQESLVLPYDVGLSTLELLEQNADLYYNVIPLVNNSYPAIAICDLVLRDTDYTGPAIRVRRESDQAEQDFGFNNQRVLDTAAVSAWVGTDPTDQGYVVRVYDQTGNGYHAEQTAAASQPKIVTDGIVHIDGGLPYMDNPQGSNKGFIIDPWTMNPPRIDAYHIFSTTDNKFAYNRGTSSNYTFYASQNDISTTINNNSGTPSLYINGSLRTPATRDEVHTELATGNWQVVLFENIDGTSFAWYHWGRSSDNGQKVGPDKKRGIMLFDSDQSANRTNIMQALSNPYSIY